MKRIIENNSGEWSVGLLFGVSGRFRAGAMEFSLGLTMGKAMD